MRIFNATVEVEHRGGVDVETAMTALEGFHPAVGRSERGHASATISLPGETLERATAAAVALVERAFGATALYAEVMTESEFLARQGWDSVPDLVSVTEAAEILGVSRSAVQQRIDSGSLPAEKIGNTYALPRAAVVTGARPTNSA